MATRDTLIEVPLKATLDQGKDEPSVVAPGLLALENGILTKDGGVQKRLGAQQKTGAALILNHEANWIHDYEGQAIMGTTQGVASFANGTSWDINAPCATYDTTVDHKALSGIPNYVVEIDSATALDVVSGTTYTVVVFTTDTTNAKYPQSGNVVWYAIYNADTCELVSIPRQITTGSITRPHVVFNGQAASFWWIQSGTTVSYTNGRTINSLVSGAGSFFVNTSAYAGTDTCWLRLSGSDVCYVFIISGTSVTAYFASGNLVSWSAGGSDTLAASRLRIECLQTDGQIVTVCPYEGASSPNLGRYTLRQYNVATNAFFGSTQTGVLYASPADTTPGYSIAASVYMNQCTRLVLGVCAASVGGGYRTAIWASTFYGNSPFYASRQRGTGSCTTFASVPQDLSQAPTAYEPIFGYAITTRAFSVRGRNGQAVGLARSGVWATQARAFEDPDPGIQTGFAEDFSACVFVAPSEPPFHPFYIVSPVSRAFDLRVPVTAVSSTVDNQNVVTNTFVPFSLARTYEHGTGDFAVSVFMKTRVSGAVDPAGRGAFTLADYSFERARVVTFPEPQRRYNANSISVGRGIANYFDGAYSCEIVPHDVALMNDGVFDTIEPDAAELQCIYVWEDSKGNLHRSAPSTVQGAFGTTPIISRKVNVWDFPISAGRNQDIWPLQPRYVEMYQLEEGIMKALGRLPFQVGVRNATAPHLRTYTVFDFARQFEPSYGAPVLYTTGGVLENQAPPVFKDTCIAKGRIFGLTDTKLFYSKPIEDRVAPEFNYALTVDIPDDTGATTAIMAMDDKLVVLCERGTYVLYGDGPNALGTGGQFAQLLRIPGNIGCAYPGSAVECPLGIAFLSQQGMYLLDRGVNLSFVGDAIQTETNAILNGNTPYGVLAAVHDIEGRHVRWIVEQRPGEATQDVFNLVWYYEDGQWGMFSSDSERQSIYRDNKVESLIALGQTPYLIRETPDVGTYDGKNFAMRVKTGWIRFANIEGFQRAKEIAITYRPGKQPDGNTWEGLLAYIYSDYTDAINSTHQWTASQMTGIYTLDAVKQRKDFSISVKTQKTPAISVEFRQVTYELQGVPFFGIGAVLSGISVVVGAKSGTNKQNLATARTR